MKIFRLLAVFVAFGMAIGAQNANAQTWDKLTKVTISAPMQVPGKVLPAGTYWFRLYNSPSNRHIVRIFKEDKRTLVTTVLAIPNYRLNATDKTVMSYAERPVNQPEALSAWFYPGDKFGQQFVYPKTRAAELAAVNKVDVPSTGSEEAFPADSDEAKVDLDKDSSTLVAENAPQQPPPQAAPSQTYSSPASSAPAATTTTTEANELPKTASSLPLIALMGFFSLGAAYGLRKMLRA